jgi:Flp pilus assembly protein TadD
LFFRSPMTRRPAVLLAVLLAALSTACQRHETPGPAAGGAPTAAPAAGPGAAPAPETAPAERPRTIGELEHRARKSPPILFIGLDGADWQQLEPLIASGALPNLARLRASSAWGELETEVPTLSPLLWTTMFTGVSPVEHGILDFARFHPGTGTREPITSDERQVPALWNLETWAGRTVDVLGLWATYPAETVRGVLVSDRLFGFLNVEDEPPPGAIYPPDREGWAHERLRSVWQATDYRAVADYLPWLSEEEYRQHADSERPYEHPISALRRILVETRLYTGLAQSLLEERVPDLMVLYLQGTDSIGHVFAPFAPPRQPTVSEEEYQRYHEVPERYFRELDGRLGKLLEVGERAGATIVVASDHGFYWGEGRPDKLSSFANTTAAKWHRKEGIWLVHAPGVRPGRAAKGALRQIFPTLLSLTGLPPAPGGETRPLDGLAPPPPPPYDYLRVFRELAARRREVAATASGDRSAEQELEKLRALGYLAAGETGQAPEAVRASGSTRTAGSYNNEGVVLRGEHRDAEARKAFEKAIEIQPDLASALWNLSDLLYNEKQFDRSDDLLARAVAANMPEGVKYLVGRAIGYQRASELARSVALLDRAVAARPEEKEYWLFRGRYRVEAGNCQGAVTDFEQAAKLAPDDPAVYSSEALAHLCLGDRDSAISSFRHSLAIDPNQPRVRELMAKLGASG